MYESLAVDILVLGGGGAGLMAALHARRKGPELRIAVAAKGLVGQSGCTRMVQGGYNAVMDPRDSFDLHFEDTVRGGAFINDQELAWVLVNQAPGIIGELERLGCFFDRDSNGRIYQKAFAGQTFDRTVHRGDLTGIEIMSRLKENVLASGLLLLDEQRGVSLLADGEGGTGGALLLDVRTGGFTAVSAKATLVATGGGARMYNIAAPSLEKSGDGMALCYRAGCMMRDMEMFQFHPTGLVAGKSILTGAVLEEGLRGAGGYLFNAVGERFMERHDPQRMERSTRDLVSRAAYMEIQAGRATPDGAVLLDVSHLGAKFVENTFPGMVERCREVGFDLARAPVKVSPTAHFHMGGASIDQWCRTGLEGLFVAGEDSGGVHGANRLGGNGVAESTVFGALAGDAMAEFAAGRPQPEADPAQVKKELAEAVRPLRRKDGQEGGQEGGENIHAIRREIEALMWAQGGLVRDGPGLESAIASLDEMDERASRALVPPLREYNLAWQEWLNVQNILTVARLACWSALARRESRGSHYRSDYPDTDNREWLCNILVRRGPNGAPQVWREEVKLTRLQPGQSGSL
jgi:succinate dehydrogenase / fumarate reductase flavoprotein subunit/fumarate reductase flavoprotein subunit